MAPDEFLTNSSERTKITKNRAMKGALRLAVLLVAAIPLGCRSTETLPATPPDPAPFPYVFDPRAVPAAGDSGQPQLTASARGVVLSWLEQSDTAATLKFSELAADQWAAARTVAASDAWFVTDADVPTVMRKSDGTLVATTYPSVDPAIEAYDLRVTYSRDEGKTWSQPLTPHHDGTKAQHGFASLFEMPGGALGLVWLDGRVPQSMSVYFASFDAAWKQTAESSVNARVCECCPMAVAMTADGPLVAFRDRTNQEIRDIHVTRMENPSTSLGAGGTWTAAVPVHADNWRIEACPVNGPALSARGRTVAVAWFTAKGNDGQAYAAFSQDAGRTWGEPIRLDDRASLGRVDIELLDDGSAVATWVEFANERAQLRARQVSGSGERSAAATLAGADERRLRGYPRLVRNGNDLVLAWTESGDGPGPQQVKSAIGRLQ
jgi:hypothetical protein